MQAGEPVAAGRVEPPFQDDAFHGERAGDLTAGEPIGFRPDVDDQAAVALDLEGLVRADPRELLARFGQQVLDAVGAEADLLFSGFGDVGHHLTSLRCGGTEGISARSA
ncbi:hypothetical protein GCM10027597_35690 [Saccharopolyspora tripterygii]